MQQNNPIKSGLSPHLFWDVNHDALDWEKHISLILERVIQRGTYKNLLLIETRYGNEKIVETLKQLSFLNSKDIQFVHTYYKIPLNQLKCYTKKQLNQNFLD